MTARICRRINKELPSTLIGISGCKDNGAANNNKVNLKQTSLKINEEQGQ